MGRVIVRAGEMEMSGEYVRGKMSYTPWLEDTRIR